MPDRNPNEPAHSKGIYGEQTSLIQGNIIPQNIRVLACWIDLAKSIGYNPIEFSA